MFLRTDERQEGGIMKVVAHELTRQRIEDVAIYLQPLSKQRLTASERAVSRYFDSGCK